METNKLAVILLGNQNSGKTITIKYFDKKYDEQERNKKYCRSGWRHLQLYKDKLDALFALIYFIPASPSETKYSLDIRLKGFKPELLLIAEQAKGKEYQNTIDFLEKNNYKIIEFELSRNSDDNVWGGWNDNNMNDILEQRAICIGNEFRKFVLERIS